jgi:hypothetical protein
VTTQPASFLATRRGRLTLLLLCPVQFLDVADSAGVVLAAAVIALRATNTRGEPAAHPDHLPASHDRIPTPDLTD